MCIARSTVAPASRTSPISTRPGCHEGALPTSRSWSSTKQSGRIFLGNDGGTYTASNAGATWTRVTTSLAISQFLHNRRSRSDARVPYLRRHAGQHPRACSNHAITQSWRHLLGATDSLSLSDKDDPTPSTPIAVRKHGANHVNSGPGSTYASTMESARQGTVDADGTEPINGTLYSGRDKLWVSSNPRNRNRPTWTA